MTQTPHKHTAINAFEKLRATRLKSSTKPFQARGASVIRCQSCQLSQAACLCSWRHAMASEVDIVLLMHDQEILKPTNTGRLIADCFPQNCHAFLWARTEPDQEMLALLNDPQRQCFILFPGEFRSERELYSSPSKDTLDDLCKGRTPTVILLDGTWKQARKMYLSKWLHTLPTLSLEPSTLATYKLRTAPKEHQLSTAEAGIMVLNAFEQTRQANLLARYFDLFNHHYQAVRETRAPEMNHFHQAMESIT
ncbi:tRNA-uridine aminocarboxypropyltransferase [Litoribrevibacter albus]|uniref:tRNA-uridine aminocarboxypropyltransferase n=1 Tax=Litoribrevibacter albus TaxID=1473156 RepID=A0AA37SA14_9GAMM|nr:DTW domain-containing protein [Litoribrevibacter albus]GLQ31223.1 DTW domain-containing protein [Litoribrevibacter albus]